jgi:hypothetical protein
MTLDEWCALDLPQQRRQFYLELRAWWNEQAAKGKAPKPGWVAQKYRARFGRWPPDGAERLTPAKEVSIHVRDWVIGQQIAWHKERRRKELVSGGRGSIGARPTRRRSAGTAKPGCMEPAGSA